MLICPNCGSSIPEGTKFCPECGEKLEVNTASDTNHRICPFCGEVLEPDSSYYGSWENGIFDGLGAGGVKITDFWNANGHEYAVGRISWPDGIHAVMYLARP